MCQTLRENADFWVLGVIGGNHCELSLFMPLTVHQHHMIHWQLSTKVLDLHCRSRCWEVYTAE